MRQGIQVISSKENFFKVQNLFSKNRNRFTHAKCNCVMGVDFSTVDRGVTVIYPDQVLPECINCIKKAKTKHTGVFLLADNLDIQQMIDAISAGAEDCFIKETFYLAEIAINDFISDVS